MRKLLITALLLFAPAISVAGPWCLVLDAQENCRYIEAEECYTAANTRGGYCKPNPREFGISGIGPYCVITEGRRNCNYRSQSLCLRRAMQVGGGCVRNTERDLARRAAGESRLQGCATGEAGCEGSFNDFSGRPDSGGFSPGGGEQVDLLPEGDF